MNYQLIEWRKSKSWGRVSWGWESVSGGTVEAMSQLQAELEIRRPDARFLLLAPGETIESTGLAVTAN